MRFLKQSGFAWVLCGLLVTGMTTSLSASAQNKPMKHAHRAQLATGAALAPDGRLWVVGLNERGQLFTQSSHAQALGQWTAPVLLNTQQDEIAAEGESRPKMAFGPQGWAVVTYTQPLPKPYTGFVRMLRSTDGGQTFSAPSPSTKINKKLPIASNRFCLMHRATCTRFGLTSAICRPKGQDRSTLARPFMAMFPKTAAPPLVKITNWPITLVNVAASP